MNKVNVASLAYISTQVYLSPTSRNTVNEYTQVRFALSSASVFTRSDTEFDSVRFYNTVVTFLEDPDEKEEVNELLTFWNQYVF